MPAAADFSPGAGQTALRAPWTARSLHLGRGHVRRTAGSAETVELGRFPATGGRPDSRAGGGVHGAWGGARRAVEATGSEGVFLGAGVAPRCGRRPRSPCASEHSSDSLRKRPLVGVLVGRAVREQTGPRETPRWPRAPSTRGTRALLPRAGTVGRAAPGGGTAQGPDAGARAEQGRRLRGGGGARVAVPARDGPRERAGGGDGRGESGTARFAGGDWLTRRR